MCRTEQERERERGGTRDHERRRKKDEEEGTEGTQHHNNGMEKIATFLLITSMVTMSALATRRRYHSFLLLPGRCKSYTVGLKLASSVGILRTLSLPCLSDMQNT